MRIALAGTLIVLLNRPVAAQQISITELWSTAGSEQTELLVSIKGMSETGDGSIWIAEGRGKAYILAVDAHGSPDRIVARDGDGPGELRAPHLIAGRPDGGTAVYDISRSSIELFDREAHFERRVKLAAQLMNPKGFDVLPTGAFVLSGGMIGNAYAIHQFAKDGSLIRSFHPVPETQNPRAGIMAGGGPVEALPDGSILFSQAAPYNIIHYSADGDRGARVRLRSRSPGADR